MPYRDPEKERKRRLEYNQKNREKNREKSREYYHANKKKVNERQLAWREKNKDRRREYREKNKEWAWGKMLWRCYKITASQYWAMHKMRAGKCWYPRCEATASDKTGRRLAVDHSKRDPDKGRVRGLLCSNHNRYFVGKFTIEQARDIVTYLSNKDFDGRNLNPWSA